MCSGHQDFADLSQGSYTKGTLCLGHRYGMGNENLEGDFCG
jgi:hypothetical protein